MKGLTLTTFNVPRRTARLLPALLPKLVLCVELSVPLFDALQGALGLRFRVVRPESIAPCTRVSFVLDAVMFEAPEVSTVASITHADNCEALIGIALPKTKT